MDHGEFLAQPNSLSVLRSGKAARSVLSKVTHSGVLQLDDCWSAKTRDAQGNLQWVAKQFPNGLPALADYIHKLGLKFGVCESVVIPVRLRLPTLSVCSRFQTRALARRPAAAGALAATATLWRTPRRWLRTVSFTASLAVLMTWFAAVQRWGVDWVKADFCHRPSNETAPNL